MEALKRFRKRPVDIFISDIQMPVMDGYRLMGELKSLPQELPVVLITGQTIDPLQGDGIEKAAETVRYNPFRLEAIQAVLKRILRF